MAINKANLIVTNATWGDTVNPLADTLAKDGNRYSVDVDVCPLSKLELTNDARQRAVLRELADWDEINDTRPLRVIAANPYAPEALEKFEQLVSALKLRKDRISFAAIDNDTGLLLSEIVRFIGLSDAQLTDIQTPKLPGSVVDLSKQISNHSEANELCLVLEEVEEVGGLAKRLLSDRQRVIRMPIFQRIKHSPDELKLSETPNFILINDAFALAIAIQGLKRLAVDMQDIVWVGTSSSLEVAVKRDAPGSKWLGVSDLRHDVILDQVSKY